MKTLLFYVSVLWYLCITNANLLYAQTAVTISPSIVRFNTAPGKAETKIISIKNNSKKLLAFKINVQDWIRDSVGKHIYYKADTLSHSCASMLSIEPSSYIQIDSGKTGKIFVRMQPSTTASNIDMKWAMLFIESLPEEIKDKKKLKRLQMQVNIAVEVGVHIYQTPPGAVTKAVENVRLVTDSIQKGFVYLYMKNVGQVMLDCKAHLELTHLSTAEETITKDVIFPVFPDGSRKAKLDLPKNIKPGSYSLLVILDYGVDVPLEAVQQNVTIMPTTSK